jgi:shikimate kinase
MMKARPEWAVRVVLVGMMGSGKSTIGRLLAGQTGWPYHDNDALVERATGVDARELLASRGEAALREAESAALALGLNQPPPCIVATAAGTVVDAANRAKLAKARVVWLRARPETLARRARGAPHRPWLDADAAGWMRTTLGERAPLYQSVADLVVDTDRWKPDDVAADIINWLRGRDAYHSAQ